MRSTDERLIGMVQPSEPQDDNRGGGALNPPVYPVGCAGRITAFTETDDGRYLVTLTGVSRFRIRRGIAAAQRLSPRQRRLGALRGRSRAMPASPSSTASG